jgi:hypothetical protein
LIFLYFQLRQVNAQLVQAEKNQQAAITQARTESQVSVLIAMADPGVAEALRRANEDPESLSSAEFAQFTTLHRALMTIAENTFLQHKAGQITDAPFESFVRAMKSTSARPAFRAYWPIARNACGREFAEFVDRTMAEASLAPRIDVLALLELTS